MHSTFVSFHVTITPLRNIDFVFLQQGMGTSKSFDYDVGVAGDLAVFKLPLAGFASRGTDFNFTNA